MLETFTKTLSTPSSISFNHIPLKQTNSICPDILFTANSDPEPMVCIVATSYSTK